MQTKVVQALTQATYSTSIFLKSNSSFGYIGGGLRIFVWNKQADKYV